MRLGRRVAYNTDSIYLLIKPHCYLSMSHILYKNLITLSANIITLCKFIRNDRPVTNLNKNGICTMIGGDTHIKTYLYATLRWMLKQKVENTRLEYGHSIILMLSGYSWQIFYTGILYMIKMNLLLALLDSNVVVIFRQSISNHEKPHNCAVFSLYGFDNSVIFLKVDNDIDAEL